MAELDQLLSETLKRVSTPGDPAGVAEAIRSRVASGDVGTPAPRAPLGGNPLLAWLPWIGVVLVAALVGGIAGFTGLFGLASPVSASALAVSIDHSVAGLACPAGSKLVSLDPGQRVLAVQRSQDSAWLAVRDPYDLATTVWVSRTSVRVDRSGDTSTLPVGGCPAPSVSVTPEPTVEAAAPEEPATPSSPSKKPAPPAQPGDTTAPAITAGTFSPQPVYGDHANQCPTQSTITVTATDNVAIASVTGSSAFATSSVVLASHAGSSWVFRFSSSYNGVGAPDTTATVIFTATDSSGNHSSVSKSLTVRTGNYMNCWLG